MIHNRNQSNSVCRDWPDGLLRIATGVWEPAVFNCSLRRLLPSVGCPTPGFDAESLGLILTALDCPYTLQAHYGDDVNWGSFNDADHIDGLLAAVLNESIATIGTRFTITGSVRVKKFQFR